MPITINHNLTATTPDDPSYEIRPSHWNSAHDVTVSLATNEVIKWASAGANSISSGTLNFSNSNNVTFGMDANGVVTASANAAGVGDGFVYASAGTQVGNSTGTLLFANSNGVTFGMSNSSVITASHNGLTTAMASNRGTDFVQATAAFAGTSASGTIASNGISVSIGPYITTAMLSNAATISNINVSAGTTSNNLSALTFANGSGVSFGLNGSTLTATVKTDYLTSQSNQAVSGANGSFTFQTVTFANSNGVSFSTGTQGLYATVATNYAASDHSHGNPTLNLTNLSGTTASNSAGFTLSLSAAAGGAADGVNILAAGTQTANTTGTVLFNNSNGITFGMSNSSVITASHNGLTTAAASDHSHGNPTLNLTNLSGTTASNSAGFTLSLSANAPGAAAENNAINLLGANTAGNTTATGSTIGWSGHNLTLSGTNGSQVVISAPATSSLSATGIVSLSTNGSTISIGAPMASGFWNDNPNNLTYVSAPVNASASVVAFQAPNFLTATRADIFIYQSISSSAVANTYGQQWSIYVGIYTNDTAASKLNSVSSGSTQTTYTVASNTAGQTQIIGSGVRPISCPINMSLTPGVYHAAVNYVTSNFSSGTATTAFNRTASILGFPTQSASFAMVGDYSVATAATVNSILPQGVFSAASTGLPGAISYSQFTMTGASRLQANIALLFRS